MQGELDPDLKDLWCAVMLNPYDFQADDAGNIDTAPTARMADCHVADCQRRYP